MRDAGGINPRRGLKTDIAKAQAWQRRSAIRYAAKLRARRQTARLTSSITKKPTRSRNDWPTAVRRLARRRSGGLCELCAEQVATDLHHRKARRHRDHRVCNALHLCRRCHDAINNRRTWARVRGLTVSPTDDPADVPVELLAGSPVFLTLTGTYREAA